MHHLKKSIKRHVITLSSRSSFEDLQWRTLSFLYHILIIRHSNNELVDFINMVQLVTKHNRIDGVSCFKLSHLYCDKLTTL